MNRQGFQNPRNFKEWFRLGLLILPAVLFAITIKAYFSVRLELMEARGVLSDVLFSSCVISKSIAKGDADKASALSITNQLKGIQYAIRRDIKDANIYLATEYCFKKGNLTLNDRQRGFYLKYVEDYKDWESSGWLDDNLPLMDQLMDVLLYYWPDSRPRWTTWKPRDYATNIKVGSPEERSRKSQTRSEDKASISEKLSRAIERTNNKSDSDEETINRH